jgi:hypothetical protein
VGAVVSQSKDRIAHHEPILRLPLDARYASIHELTGWIEADAAAWIDQTSTWQRVFLGSPTLEVDPATGIERVHTGVMRVLLVT